MMDGIKQLAEVIRDSRKTVFLGGAGVSTESNIPDFRSAAGLYRQGGLGIVPPEQILSATFFYAHTEDFYEFYRKHMIYPDAQPNDAHRALACLERAGYLDLVATQNIDSLHQMAGSQMVAELHGTVHRNECLKCKTRYDLQIILDTEGIPRCPRCGGLIKPLVTLYEESLPEGVYERVASATRDADLLIVGGTSLSVYPAAYLARDFRGKTLAIINYQTTSVDESADIVLHESIGGVLRQVAEELGVWIDE